MFQFSCRLAFSTSRFLNRTPKITQILTLYQANVATLTPFSKRDKILIKNLYGCKGYNARHSISKFLNKAWTKNSFNRLLMKFGTVNRRPGSGRRGAHRWKRRHCRVAVAESGRAIEQSEKFHMKRGDPSIISFADYSQRSASQVLQEKACLTADWSAQHARVIFGMQLERRYRDNKQTYMKTETCKLLSLLNISAKYHQKRSI